MIKRNTNIQNTTLRCMRIVTFFVTVLFVFILTSNTAKAANEMIQITQNNQFVDSFCGVKAEYVLVPSDTGVYSCAGYVKKFYAALYGVNVYSINTYDGPPVVSSDTANVSLRQVVTPQPGDIMQNKSRGHVGIVKSVSGTTATLIEQNWKWSMGGKTYCRINRTLDTSGSYFYRLVINGKDVAPASESVNVPPKDHEVWQMMSSGGVNLRKSRSTSSTLLKTMPYGKIVKVVEKKKDASGNIWAKTTYEGKTGWFLTIFACYDWGSIENVTPDTTPPVISNIKVTDVNINGYTVSCTVTDNRGVVRVQFPTWTTNDGQDDLKEDWSTNAIYAGSVSGSTYTFKVRRIEHGNEYGVYNTHIYAYDAAGNSSSAIADLVELGIPALPTEFYSYIKNEKSGKFVTFDSTQNYACVAKYTGYEGQLWKFTKKTNGYYTITNIKNNKRLGVYKSKDNAGMHVKLMTPKDTNSQMWRIYGDNGKYVIKSALSTYVMTLKGDNTYSGNKIRMNSQSRYSTSIFMLETVEKLDNIEFTVVTQTAYNKVNLRWNVTNDCSGYMIYKMNNATGKYQRIKKINSAAVDNYTTMVNCGENAQFVMKSFKKAKGGYTYSVYSKIASIATKMGMPQSAGAVLNEDGTVTVSWAKTAGAQGFEIYRSTDGAAYKKIGTTNKLRKIVDAGADISRNIRYKVRAYRVYNGKKVRSAYIETDNYLFKSGNIE